MKKLIHILFITTTFPLMLTVQPIFADSYVDPIGMSDFQRYNLEMGLDPSFASRDDASVLSQLINSALPYLLTGAGLILFAMLISGGFTMMTAVTDPKKAEAGKARIIAAIIGFILVFGAYWITQILQIVLGVKILN